MPRLTPIATLLIVIATLSTGATAQNTYKCGSSYSQTPCPDSVIVDARDPRTGAQKMQADLSTARDARTVDAMEKARRQQEKMDQEAYLPQAKPTTAGAASSSPDTQAAKKKKKVPEYFTAQVPGKKKKPTPKQSARNKNASPA